VVLAGVLRESIVIETPVEIRNEVGEATQEWVEFARRRAGVEQIGYTELQRMNQTGGSATFTVRLRYVAGVSGNMRIRWVSRANRILYIASIVESGNRQEHEFTCEERA
jgi:SPP1 family predicted phage head-tail adaptor